MEQRDNQDSKDGQKRSTDQQGQSAASSGSYDDSDTLTQQDQGYGDSTSAQRSGGQSIRGQGSTDQSFEGSSFGGQSGGQSGQNSPFIGQQQGHYVDRDGQDAGATSQSSQRETDQDEEQSDLDGQ
ncbi:hypothetical protein [Sphingomonas sp.]|uniref:hypothetical protein n=1 Tax=Sphingomonas sp. TaxID=28214 RepID=UPI00325FA140